MEFVYPILIFVVMGIVFGVLLVVISKVFAVKTDERAVQITEALPDRNAVPQSQTAIGRCVVKFFVR